MKENEEIKKLEQIKYYLKEKEQAILISQIKQNKTNELLKKLEIKIAKMEKKEKNILSKIISFLIYNIIMLSIIMLFIYYAINHFTTPSLLTTVIYIGTLFISVTGAYLLTKLESHIIKCHKTRKLNLISNKIKECKGKIELEIDKQKQIKKEISEIIDYLDNKSSQIKKSHNFNSYISYKKTSYDADLREKTKHILKQKKKIREKPI